jgi:2-polyprenyl-3-methyl-5-hydroxy-6-metoxy-1,4-benzoquinol methylase
MNRKARRAEAKSGKFHINAAAAASDRSAPFSIADLMAQATRQFQSGGSATAEIICHQVLALEPGHVHALNLLGLILQGAGRHKAAAKTLEKAVASDPYNAACHYNLATSFQALDRHSEAAANFTKAITLGARQNNAEKLILQSPAIAACVQRIDAAEPWPASREDIVSPSTWHALATDIFLRCALGIVPLRGVALERFLTLIRAALLDLAHAHFFATAAVDDDLVPLFIAVAQQCFINEYVFTQSEREAEQAQALRTLLLQKSTASDEIAPLLLTSVAAYVPLHSLPEADVLAARRWPQILGDLVRQALCEPLQEIDDAKAIPVLTGVDDEASLRVMRQYEQNPYPRWTLDSLAAQVEDGGNGVGFDDPLHDGENILIAGCGTGQHAVEIARRFPKAHVLAVDISLPSLAYARRKTREAGLNNVDYAKADILGLGSLGRSFDRIETIGVLHHLADPEHGWRILLSMLRPGGIMRVGLYSETARRSVTSVRAFIAERAYRPTAEDIRQCRQDIIRSCEERGWLRVIESADFYSMSGCRDLLFNAVEHRFTIPRIKAFLDANGLSFLGFETEPWVGTKFREQCGATALTDLDAWGAFEADNPLAFRYMYVLSLCKA